MSSHTLQGMWLLIHAGIKLNHISIALCCEASVNVVYSIFRGIPILMHVLYSHPQLSPTWIWKIKRFPDSKVHGANMGSIWGRQDPGGPHVGPMNFAFWVVMFSAPSMHDVSILMLQSILLKSKIYDYQHFCLNPHICRKFKNALQPRFYIKWFDGVS